MILIINLDIILVCHECSADTTNIIFTAYKASDVDRRDCVQK